MDLGCSPPMWKRPMAPGESQVSGGESSILDLLLWSLGRINRSEHAEPEPEERGSDFQKKTLPRSREKQGNRVEA